MTGSGPVPLPGGERGTPPLSIVVIMFTSEAHLDRCLDALGEQARKLGAEILVPHDDSLEVATVRSRHPAVTFVHSPGRRTPAELRARATLRSRAPLVAFLEDHCLPAPDWCQAVLRSHEREHAAVGGPVEKGFPPGRSDDSALNWAVYFTDYSRYMLPMPEGPAQSLTDCNVSYKRAALDAVAEAWTVELHENVVNGLLRQRQETLWFDPNMAVLEQRDLTLGQALRDRWSFGRLFGSTRAAGASLPRRLAYGAAALLMPPVLVVRVARTLTARGKHHGPFLRCLPHLFLVTGAWMAGESLGYVSGRSGRALTPRVPPA